LVFVGAPYACFRLIDRNRTLSFIAFWATAPGVRFNFFATAVPDNFAFASSLSVRTSSFDHATIRRLDFDFAFAMNVLQKRVDMIARKGSQCCIAAALAKSRRFALRRAPWCL
jgi:hypothetical protein